MRTRTWIPPFLAVCLAVACSGTRTGSHAGATPTAMPASGTLVASGNATIDVTPDLLDIVMTLSAEDPSPKNAVRALRKRQVSFVEQLGASGVRPDEIRVSYVNLGPTWDAYGEGSRIRGYTASVTVVVSTKNFDLLGEIVERAAGAGATNVSTSFRVSDLVALKKQVRDQALAAAQDNARQMAKTLGISLDRISAVSETPSGMWSSLESGMLDARGVPTDLPVHPARQPLTLSVSITYQIAS